MNGDDNGDGDNGGGGGVGCGSGDGSTSSNINDDKENYGKPNDVDHITCTTECTSWQLLAFIYSHLCVNFIYNLIDNSVHVYMHHSVYVHVYTILLLMSHRRVKGIFSYVMSVRHDLSVRIWKP